MSDERAHRAFDRYLLPKSPSNIPKVALRNFELSLRTAYTTLLCLVASRFWSWAGASTYISPTLSAISSTRFFGVFMGNFAKALLGGACGSLVGSVIGLLFRLPALQLLMIFTSLAVFNGMEHWDRAHKVYCSLNLVLGSLWPTISAGQISGLTSIQYSISLIVVPYIITGACLLFPFPSLVSNYSIDLLSNICHELSTSNTALIQSFCSQEFRDVYLLKFEYLFSDAEKQLNELSTYSAAVKFEAMVFPRFQRLVEAMELIIPIFKCFLTELLALKETIKHIIASRVQEKLAENLREILESISFEITISLRLISEAFLKMKSGGCLEELWKSVFGRLAQSEPEATAHRSRNGSVIERMLIWDSSDYLISLRKHRHIVEEEADTSSFARCERAAIYLSRLKSDLLKEFEVIRKTHIWTKNSADEFGPSQEYVLLENHRSIRNLYSRGAYVNRVIRILAVIESSVDKIKIFDESPLSLQHQHPHPHHDFSKFLCHAPLILLSGVWASVIRIARDLVSSARKLVVERTVSKKKVQACKTALAMIFMSLFVVLKSWSDKYQNGLWAVIVIALIQQDSVSSSFLVGYQRIEGTVVGAVFAFSIFQALDCQAQHCRPFQTFPILVIWLAICSFFREGPHHGYAAIVAGFTPIVLFEGPVVGTSEGAWRRVEMTFLGIAVYLILDNVILPNRSDSSIRKSVLESIRLTSELVQDIFGSFRAIVDPMSSSESPQGQVSIEIELTQDTIGPDGHHHYPDIEFSRSCLDRAERKLLTLQQNYATQSSLIKLVSHEPFIWNRAFPVQPYVNNIRAVTNFANHAHSLVKGLLGFIDSIELLRRNAENFGAQFGSFIFIITRLVESTDRITKAFAIAANGFERLYNAKDINSDLVPLITLSNFFEKLLSEADEKFYSIYGSKGINLITRIEFLIAWQGVYESTYDFIQSLSQVGFTLHSIREMEALSLS